MQGLVIPMFGYIGQGFRSGHVMTTIEPQRPTCRHEACQSPIEPLEPAWPAGVLNSAPNGVIGQGQLGELFCGDRGCGGICDLVITCQGWSR